MRVGEARERYRCIVCGKTITVTKAGEEELVCCGEDMELLS